MYDFFVGDIVWMIEKEEEYVCKEVTIKEEKNINNDYKVDSDTKKNILVPKCILYGYPDKCEKRCEELNTGCIMTEEERRYFVKVDFKDYEDEKFRSPWGIYITTYHTNPIGK